MYDALMKKIRLNTPYPIDGPRLRTKKNIRGARYEFNASHVIVLNRKTVRVQGQTPDRVWCRLEYPLNAPPKWLKDQLKALL